MTPLDTAHAKMDAASEDDAARLAFYARLAEAELHLLLAAEPTGQTVEPRVFDLEDGPLVAVFDTAERLAEFAGAAVPCLVAPGRRVAAMLAGQGVSLGLNLGVAPSAFVLPPDAVAWLADTASSAPTEIEAQIHELVPPGGLPDTLLTALDGKLARAAGLARGAYLSGVRYRDGRRGHLLALIDASPGADTALAEEISEALAFSGLDAAALDVVFVNGQSELTSRLSRVGLRFDLPLSEAAVRPPPGSDPDTPPRLR